MARNRGNIGSEKTFDIMESIEDIVDRFRVEFVSQIISTVAGAVLVIYLGRTLSNNGYGLLFLSISIFSIASIFSKMGIGRSASTYISQYKIRDEGQVLRIIKISFLYNIGTVTAVSVVVVFGRNHISAFVGEPQLSPFLSVGALFIIFNTFMSYVRSCFQGFEEIRIAAILNIANSLIRLFSSILLITIGFGALGGLIGYIIGFFIVSLIGLSILYAWFYRNYESKSREDQGLGFKIFRYSLPITLTSSADVIDRQVDILLVGFFLNPAAVSFYVVGKQILTFIKTPLSALGFTLSPTFGAKKAEGNIEQASKIYEISLINSLLLYIPAAVGLYFIAEPLISLIFGTDYINSAPILKVLTIYGVMLAVTQITSNSLDYLGRAKARSITKGVTAILNAALNILLIPRIGVIGAAIATVISFGIYTSLNFYIISIEFDIRYRYIGKRVLTILFISMFVAAGVYPLSTMITNWVSLLSVVFVGVAIWATLSILLGMIKPVEVRRVLK